MHDNVHSVHGPDQALAIAHVTDKITQARVVKASRTHFVLLKLVTAEDNDFLGILFGQQDFGEFFAERAGTTGNEDNFIVPVHECSYLTAFNRPESFVRNISP